MKRWALNGPPSPAQIAEITATLLAGGIVLMPTDTIYGLHAIAGSAAESKIGNMKGRDEQKRFVTLAASIDQAVRFGATVPVVLRDIWPAPLTAIMRRGDGTIAIRIPDLGWLREILERTGPLVSTSANRAGEPPITLPDQLPHDVRDALDGIADGGFCEGKASAIVDFTGDQPNVIREGDSRFTQNLWKTLRKCL